MINESVFSFLRYLVGAKCYLLLLNTSLKCINIDMTGTCQYLPKEAFLVFSNGHFQNMHKDFDKLEVKKSECMCQNKISVVENGPVASTSNNKIKIRLNNIHLKPKEAVILSFIGEKKP